MPAREPMRLINRNRVGREDPLSPAKAIDCLAHRCAEHVGVPMHNQAGPQSSECGGCVMNDTVDLYEQSLDLLDAYALRLHHHAILKRKLREARDRLNILAPGAGDELSPIVDE